ncbi:MAG: diguanylate cyclase [Candidatus Aegiribacteria sp.]|nr:diguanylate cyclase [Candidatus Aegiribacteria sp.]
MRITGYAILLVLFLFLASGRFRSSGSYTTDPVLLLLGTGLLLLSAALAQLVQKRIVRADGRIMLYWVCAGLLLSVQLTGGSESVFYSAYLLFLMWASLPSNGGSATELGLVIGFIEAFSLLNASIWTGGESLISRLIPLLLPALKALLVPFLFGLASDWLTEREFYSGDPAYSREKNNRGKEGKDSPTVVSGPSYPLIQIIHKNSRADSTCLFIGSDDGFYRLAEHVASDKIVISRFMLPAKHRLARIAENSRETVIIRADSKEERSELAPYRFPGAEDEGSLWIVLCPLRGETTLEGFLLQDFSGDKPSDSIISDLENLSEILQGTCSRETFPVGDEFSWMVKLVTACNENSLDKAVQGMAGILSELIPDSTISIADVDSRLGRTRVWVSRGPLARWRGGKIFDSSEGLAGWILKNRVPCSRSRIRSGGKNVHAFTLESGMHDRAGSCMGVPVIREKEVIALIMAEHEDDNAFKQYHEGILLTVAGMFSMREELAGLRQRFRNISGRDTLTALPGITLLDRHLHHMAKEVQTYGWYVGLIVADIDGFGTMNRTLGYSEADRLLMDAAARFRNCFSEDVFIARTGPDSFAACIPKAGKAVMEAMSQRAVDVLSFKYSGKMSGSFVSVSASIGSVYTHVNKKVLLLTGEAEKAVSDARVAGPGNCVVRKIGFSGSEKS